jgi:hypothetical protein
MVLTVSALFCYELFNQKYSNATLPESFVRKLIDDWFAEYESTIGDDGYNNTMVDYSSIGNSTDYSDYSDSSSYNASSLSTDAYDGNYYDYNYVDPYDSTEDSTNSDDYTVRSRVVYPLQTLFVRDLLIANQADAFAKRILPWLYTIAVAILVGFFSWQSQIANFSTPTCRFYRTQVKLYCIALPDKRCQPKVCCCTYLIKHFCCAC